MQFQEKNVQVQQYLQTIQKAMQERWRDGSYSKTMEGRKLYKNDGGTGQPVQRILTAIGKVWGEQISGM